ncbi:MAG: DUF1836 domain-containing protein [Clostridia bacterium]|nr:DUF1836 domain-containing protein [Clostridia bacterium]
MESLGIVLPDWHELPDFGLYLDQVISLTSQAYAGDPVIAPLTAGMINSYVKNGLVDRPEKKKYSRAAMAQLLMISFLKQTSSMESLRSILHPADGTDTECIYNQFARAFAQVSDFLKAHPELSRLECAIAAAVCQTACAGKAEEE